MEAPVQFRLWKPTTTDTAKATSEDKGFPLQTAQSGASKRFSILNYKPGSLLFGRKSKDVETPVESTKPVLGTTLSKYFPGLKGRDSAVAEPLRTAKATTPRLAKERTKISPDDVQPTAHEEPDEATNDSVLPVGLKVETYPKKPSASLPEAALVAQSDANSEEKPAAKAAEDAPLDAPVKPVSHDDQMADRAVAEKALVATKDSRPEVPPFDFLIEQPAKADPEVTPKPEVTPAAEPKAKTKEATTDEEESDFDPMDPPAPPEIATSMSPTTAETSSVPVASTSSEPSPAAKLAKESALEKDSVLKGRPRLGLALPIELPEPEFPLTYHGQSMRDVLKERAAPKDESANVAKSETLTKPATRPLFPRLGRLFQPKEADTKDKDTSVTQTSSWLSTKGKSAKSNKAKSSQVAERGQR
jgi:hypothetical protein